MNTEKTIDLADFISQFSFNTKEYGVLNFYKFDESDKNEKLEFIISHCKTDKKIIETLFKETFKADKNNRSLDNIDFDKISTDEWNYFCRDFFRKQYNGYVFDDKTSIKENVNRAICFETEKIEEESKKLADSLSMKYESLLSLGSSSLSAMSDLNNHIEKIFKKPEQIKMSQMKLPELQIPKDYKFEILQSIETNISDFETVQVKLFNQLNTVVQNLSETLVKLIKVNNALQEQEYKSVQEQAENSEKESKRSFKISLIAIFLSIMALFIDIGFELWNNSNNQKQSAYLQETENKQIELLEQIKNIEDEVGQNSTVLKNELLENKDSLNACLEDIISRIPTFEESKKK